MEEKELELSAIAALRPWSDCGRDGMTCSISPWKARWKMSTDDEPWLRVAGCRLRVTSC